MIPLEDSYQDILNKSLRGLGLNVADLAQKSSVPQEEIVAFRDGTFSQDTARKIAPALGLDPEAYVVCGTGGWQPDPVRVEGLHQFRNEEGMAPNFYLVHHAPSQTAIAFDTGDDASAMLETLTKLGRSLNAIFITHTHGDHIAALGSLQHQHPGAKLYVGEKEPLPSAELVRHGQQFEIGGLTIECRSTWGHSVGGITYFVSGMAMPVAIVGDALFAGSMGGGAISWAEALRTNRENIFTLPDATILCPGHGPLTTLREEKRHNPFYPEFK